MDWERGALDWEFLHTGIPEGMPLRGHSSPFAAKKGDYRPLVIEQVERGEDMNDGKVVISTQQLEVLKRLAPGKWQTMLVHQKVLRTLLEKGLIERDLDNNVVRLTEAGERAKTEHVLTGTSEYIALLRARKAITTAGAQVSKSLPGYGDALPADLKEALKPSGANGVHGSLREIAERKPLVRPFGAAAAPVGAMQPVTVSMDEFDLDESHFETVPANEENEVLDDPRPPVGIDPQPVPPSGEQEEDDEQPEDWEVDIDLPIPFVPVRNRVDYDCGPGCVHEHVLTLLREMFPEVREAAEILRQAKLIEKKLGL